MAANIVRAAAEREAIGGRARAHVEANFGWDSTFRTLFGCYEKRLAGLAAHLPSGG